MKYKTIIFLLTSSLYLTSQGCTYRTWYEGLQNRERQECYNSQSQGEAQKCLDRVNSTTYDQYKIDKENGRAR